MAVDEGLAAWVCEAMAPLGPVTRRRMFGGAALYCDGVIFAILGRDALWFKADAASNPAWNRAGAERFAYERDGRTMTMNYRRAPDEALDDEDELRRWGRLALEAGIRAAAAKRPK